MTRAKGRRVMANDTEDVEFFNVFDGTKGRSPGIYLDIQERIEAEKSRAVLEEREPDLSDLGKLSAACSTPMVPASRQVDNSVYSNPSIAFTGEKDVDPVSTLSVSTGDAAADVDLGYAAQVARERSAQDDALLAASTGDTTTDPTPVQEPVQEPVEDEVTDEPDPLLEDVDTNTNDTTVTY